MCAIAGVVRPESAPDERNAIVAALLQAQVHRGPEGCAVESVHHASFGCCRLAFVDIGLARQPYRSRDDSVLVAFNGELYNRAQLRAELMPSAGVVDPGEAAILAAMYSIHGIGMFERLSGMYAVAVYDRDRDELLLARDRFGKKPLSYVAAGSDLAFASELRALLQHPATAAELDPGAVAMFLTFNAVPAPASLVRGVRKVPPGSVVAIRRGAVRVAAHWELRLRPRPRASNDLDDLDRDLTSAVADRLDAEAPVGVFLSGGLDSGLVGAIAARQAGRTLSSFSVAFPDSPSFDETRHARELADRLGLRHTVVPLSQRDFAHAAVDVLTRVDEPLADHSLVPTVCLARAARGTIKAALTGDGADELFMGYRLFQVQMALDAASSLIPRRSIASILSRFGASARSEANLGLRHSAALLARAVDAAPEERYYWAAAAFSPAEWPGILSAEAARAARTVDPFAAVRQIVAAHPAATRLERLQLGMICHFLRDSILAKLDRGTMLASLEARSPFLDDRVVDAALALPLERKMSRMRTKFILKQLARRYLPAAIVRRPKQGFRAPIAAVLRRDLREFLCDTLAAGSVRSAGLLRHDAVERLVREHLGGARDHHRQLWALLCLASWIVAAPRPQPAARFAVPLLEEAG